MARLPGMGQRARPLVIGHRGASCDAPQNTLAAFRRAAAVGADGVELDVHLSADGVPVVIHDRRVEATTDGAGCVDAMTLAQIKALDAGAGFDSRFAGERIPTLEEVLSELGARLLVNIELKTLSYPAEGLEPAVVDVVRRLGMQERVWFSSFRPYTLYRLRALAPEIAGGLLYAPTTLGALLLRPFTPHEALHPHASLIRRPSVARMHRRGIAAVVWTVDDPAVARELAAWGVDAVITNAPGDIVAALSAEDLGV